MKFSDQNFNYKTILIKMLWLYIFNKSSDKIKIVLKLHILMY